MAERKERQERQLVRQKKVSESSVFMAPVCAFVPTLITGWRRLCWTELGRVCFILSLWDEDQRPGQPITNLATAAVAGAQPGTSVLLLHSAAQERVGVNRWDAH